ncbi:MAG: PQQ-binding-like beta-propeller repeat protein [Bacteroidales bacterium]
MKKTIIVFLSACLFFPCLAQAQTVNNWRGPLRDGQYDETNLLKEWPAGGPAMRWAFEGLGKGFTSAVPAGGKIYTSGMEGETGFIYELSEQGELLRKFPYGEEISSSYPGTRSTPTIAGDLAYVATGHGKLFCMNLDTGREEWSTDLFNELDGSNIRWGYTENLIIDGDLIYCSPGGKKYNVVALNRHTGHVVWSSPGKGGLSAYCSPLLINHQGQKILVTMMQANILGLDAGTGALLWSHPHANQRNIHPNTPLYHDNSLYCFSGYGKGGLQLRLNASGTQVTQVWENETLDPQLGGAVLVDGFIYASGDRNRRWFALDWETGEIMHETRDIDKGNVIAADGMLYAYTERGELALLEPGTGSFRIVSQTQIELGSDQHWAHLVIHNGILYVRHGNALMAFDIRKSQ